MAALSLILIANRIAQGLTTPVTRRELSQLGLDMFKVSFFPSPIVNWNSLYSGRHLLLGITEMENTFKSRFFHVFESLGRKKDPPDSQSTTE